MKILIFSEYYQPDGGPAAPLFTMLSESLAKLGHEVIVVTTVPHYPSGSVPEKFRGGRVIRLEEKGVNVIRVPLPSIDRKKLGSRFFQFFTYQIFAFFEGFKFKPDVVITHTPAFEVWLPFLIHGIRKDRKSIYSIHDVYPDVGIKMGIFRSELLIKLITSMEKKFIKNADKVRVLSRSFIDRIHELGAEKKNIELIYDWVEIDSIKPMKKLNAFSSEMGLGKSFNVVYAGNIGHIQALDTVIEAADVLKENKDIRFVFIGAGNAKHDLEAMVSQHNLENVMFYPYQPRERMGEILATADVGLVSLKEGTGFGALPSKTFSILSSGTPIIACVDPGSDTWELVEKSGGGFAIPPENPQKLAESILEIYNQPDQGTNMGGHGRKYVAEYHSPEHAAKKFAELFK